MILHINYDFIDGTELSYVEIQQTLINLSNQSKKNIVITTNCLSFFNFDYLKILDDIIVIKKDKSFISVKDLVENKGKGYTYKEIRESHNIYKMLLGNSFNFKIGN